MHAYRNLALPIPGLQPDRLLRATAPDLRKLFQAYDALAYEGELTALLDGRPLTFRWSNRMTRSAGKTTRYGQPSNPIRFEITISRLLLTQTFEGETRDITVCGVRCDDRLDALLRVFEHELVHLYEMLKFGDSSCRAPRFATLARTAFGHTEPTHCLVTPRERAARDHGIRAGVRVAFDYDGRVIEGFVNRVTKRATVLVQDPKGQPYSDGGRYAKYYVPLSELRRAPTPT